MEQITEAIEYGAALLLFCMAIIWCAMTWRESMNLYDTLETELRREHCVEEAI